MRADLTILVPAVAACAAFAIRQHAARRVLLVTVAAAHFALTAAAWWRAPEPAWGGWLAPDPLGLLFLGIGSVLFLAASVYAAGSLAREQRDSHVDEVEGLLFDNQPEAVFTGCLLLFLATLSLVCMSRHLGLLWVAVEATTLATGPMIYFHRHHRSLEAAWKYLMICSVGIALALLGNFFVSVAYAPAHAAGAPEGVPLVLDRLLAGPAPHATWLKIGFVLLLVGYGTKAGLAPMHTWLPDAHSEAPSVVSALLSGALLNVAFLGVLRALQLLQGAGLGAFAQPPLIALGLLSLGVAAVFILGQTDYKRMLAYSSVEHMGLIAIAVGLGGAAVFGGLLHAVNHSLTKAMLFLTAGNLLAVYRTKSSAGVRGALNVAPVSGALWVAGFLAIVGTPPFAPFLSKFLILKGAIATGHPWVAGAMMAALAVIFIGFCVISLRMAQGAAPEGMPRAAEPWWSLAPPVALGLAVLALGLHLPAGLERLLTAAAQTLGGLP